MTQTQLADFLKSYGVVLPDVVLAAITEQVASVQDCLEGASYSDATQTLIQLYAGAIIALGSGASVITSQSAPSGASQSFAKNEKAISLLKSQLSALDTSGCTSSLIAGSGASNYFSFAVDRW